MPPARQRRHAAAQGRRRRGRRGDPGGRGPRPARHRRSSHATPLGVDVMLPAPGQGALAVQCRAEARDLVAVLELLDHRASPSGARDRARPGARARRRLRAPLGALAVARRRHDPPRGPRVLARRRRACSTRPPQADRPGARRADGRRASSATRAPTTILERARSDPVTARRRCAAAPILVTRPAERSAHLRRRARAAGRGPARRRRRSWCEPVRSAALTAAMRDLAAGRVRLARPHLAGDGRDARRPSRPDPARSARGSRRSATGPRRRSSAGRARAPDLRPRTFTTAGLARAFPRGEGRVLCPRADIAPEGLEDALAAKGWIPDARRRLPDDLSRRACRRTRAPPSPRARSTRSRSRAPPPSAGSSRRSARSVAPPRSSRSARSPRRRRAPTGSRCTRSREPHTTDGLVDALERVFSRARRR